MSEADRKDRQIDIYHRWQQRANYILRILAGLWIATMVLGCAPQPEIRPDASTDAIQVQADSAMVRLRMRLERTLQHKGNPDSLNLAFRYLVRLGELVEPDQSFHALMTELCFLRATYTDIAQDSSQNLYQQGLRSARALLEAVPRLSGYVQTDTVSIDALRMEQLRQPTIDALYWWTLHSIFTVAQESPIRRLAWRKRFDRAIRVLEIRNPDYRNGGVQRLIALVLLISPDGDLNKAQQAFRQAIAMGESYLENRYFYARYYGVLLQSKEIFQVQLQSILEQNTSETAKYAQLNLLVKNKARTVLASTDRYFSTFSGSESEESAGVSIE
ncbi:MAG TPA: TRAP transporter TatT component family protein [bacterium]|nr:TRAP transporter TatT component family protein [bacterium]